LNFKAYITTTPLSISNPARRPQRLVLDDFGALSSECDFYYFKKGSTMTTTTTNNDSDKQTLTAGCECR